MIPAIFGAEGGGRPGKGQVVGKHSRREMRRMAQGSVGVLPSPSQPALIFVDRSIASLVKSLRTGSEASPEAGRRARVDQRAIRGKMEFFSELDWVQLFSPNIDLLGACSSHRNAKPPE